MPSLKSKLCQGQAIRRVELQHPSSETTTGISQATKTEGSAREGCPRQHPAQPLSPHDLSPYSNSPTQGHVESRLDGKASIPSFAAARPRETLKVILCRERKALDIHGQ